MSHIKDKDVRRVKATLAGLDFFELQSIAVAMNKPMDRHFGSNIANTISLGNCPNKMYILEESLLTSALLDLSFGDFFAFSGALDGTMRTKDVPEAIVGTRLFLFTNINDKIH